MNPAPYTISLTKETSQNIIDINGNLIINHIEVIYDELKGKLDFSKKTLLNVSKVEGIDLTFVQMLLSIQREFNDYGTDFYLTMDLNDEQLILLENSGFKNQFSNQS
jgi:hypothetical protein